MLQAECHASLYDGRELIGAISGIDKTWQAFDALGNLLPGSPFKSRKAAIAAVNVLRPSPCVADARMDGGG